MITEFLWILFGGLVVAAYLAQLSPPPGGWEEDGP